MKIHKYISLTLITLFYYKNITPQSAQDIVERAQKLLYSNSSYVEMTMEIIKPDWSRKLGMKIWALEPDFAMIYITTPARDKGIVTLKRKNEIWNWIPSIQKVIKIPPSMMNQSWMGSDFTNDDLIRSSSYKDDYTHNLIGTEKFNNYDCYKIESIPKPDIGIVWTKVITLISKNSYMQLKSEFYDEEGKLIKIFTGNKIKNIGGRILPTRWEMTPLDKPGNKTVIEYSKIEFDIKIDESFFSLKNVNRIK